MKRKKTNRWNWQWERLRNEDEKIFLDWIYPTKLEDYKNKLVLDAGCGNAGYSKIVAHYAKKVIALDKYSVKAARKNIAGSKKIEAVQGDIENFKYNEKFDAIYCVGVLHHLENPERGFKNLVDNLKTGGFINIWVYAREGNWLMINIIERIKKMFLLKLPLSILRVLANGLTLILYLFAWSVFFLPFSFPYKEYFKKFRQHSYARNLMNVFDKLNAPLTHWIGREQIQNWFEDLDKVVIRHYNKVSWSGFGVKK